MTPRPAGSTSAGASSWRPGRRKSRSVPTRSCGWPPGGRRWATTAIPRSCSPAPGGPRCWATASTGERLARSAHEAEPTVATAVLLGDALSTPGTARRGARGVARGGRPARRAGSSTPRWRRPSPACSRGAPDRPEEARRVLHDTAERLTDPDARDLLASHEALLASLGAPTATAAVAIAEAEMARPHLSTDLPLAGPVGGGLRLGGRRPDRPGARRHPGGARRGAARGDPRPRACTTR